MRLLSDNTGFMFYEKIQHMFIISFLISIATAFTLHFDASDGAIYSHDTATILRREPSCRHSTYFIMLLFFLQVTSASLFAEPPALPILDATRCYAFASQAASRSSRHFRHAIRRLPPPPLFIIIIFVTTLAAAAKPRAAIRFASFADSHASLTEGPFSFIVDCSRQTLHTRSRLNSLPSFPSYCFVFSSIYYSRKLTDYAPGVFPPYGRYACRRCRLLPDNAPHAIAIFTAFFTAGACYAKPYMYRHILDGRYNGVAIYALPSFRACSLFTAADAFHADAAFSVPPFRSVCRTAWRRRRKSPFSPAARRRTSPPLPPYTP